jgi:4-amino-4-deoxy-L-arabinose transferase-like glycosyltransferase
MRPILPWIAGVLLTSEILASLEGKGPPLSGWPAYVVVCTVGAGILWAVWRGIADDNTPRTVTVAVAVALAIRILVGFGLNKALPIYGYDEPPQRAGFVFRDAHTRDRDAWNLGRSDKPLVMAFTEESEGDQYGGLLYIGAFIYRYLSSTVHRTLLIVVLTAAVSAASVLVIWGFSAMTFGTRAGVFAAWIAALFPDAVLLGSSQMREPYIIFALALVFYGYALIRRAGIRRGLIIILASTGLIALPISPPYAFAGLIAVVIAWLWEGRLKVKGSKWILLALGIGAVAAFALIVRAWSTIGDIEGSGFEVLVEWWSSAGSTWQQNLLWLQSDWTRRLFASTPTWSHFPLIVFYGLLRPFLPAGIIDSGAPVWRALAIWRGLGWFIMLPFLLYAPLAAFRGVGKRSLPAYLSVLFWATAILASYRGAGDQWDNPRYRVVFLVVQAALAGWAWVHGRKTGSLWLRRTGFLVLSTTVLFTLWYRFRLRLLPSFSAVHAGVSIGIFVILFIMGALVYDLVRARRSHLTIGAKEV